MFGSRYTVSRIKDLFRRVVENLSSPQTGNYTCNDKGCGANGGSVDCAVCVKFTTSLMNCISYQKSMNARSSHRQRKRLVETVETQLMELISNRKKQRLKGPRV